MQQRVFNNPDLAQLKPARLKNFQLPSILNPKPDRIFILDKIS